MDLSRSPLITGLTARQTPPFFRAEPYKAGACQDFNRQRFRLQHLHPRLCSTLDAFLAPEAPWPFLWIERLSSQPLDLDQIAWTLRLFLKGEANIEGVSWDQGKKPRQARTAFGIHVLTAATEEQLMGDVVEEGSQLRPTTGAIHALTPGVLLLSLELLLQFPHLIPDLFCLMSQKIDLWHHLARPWKRAGKMISLPPPRHLKRRLVLVGSSEAWQKVRRHLTSDLAESGLQTQIEPFFTIEKNSDATVWWHQLMAFHETFAPGSPPPSWQEASAWGRRLTQSFDRVPLYWSAWQRLQQRRALHAERFHQNWTLETARRTIAFEQNFFQQEALRDFESGAMLMKLKGSRIGQLCGLSVCSGLAHGLDYGLPFRITCTTQVGEGELVDVDSKVGLGGPLHQKGVAILQAYLRSAFHWDHPLPISASIVSEQTYDGFDGDSGSVAEFCCWFSALAQLPLRQSLAVTGSMNQWGEVQVVGGVVEKVLGFWELCRRAGFPKGCGIILPMRNALDGGWPSKVTETIQSGQFKIHGILKAKEALFHLTGSSLTELRNALKQTLTEAQSLQEEERLSWWAWLKRGIWRSESRREGI